jgi:hypothetical protein
MIKKMLLAHRWYYYKLTVTETGQNEFIRRNIMHI